MKCQPTTRIFMVGLALLGLVMAAQAGTLRANQYYTWGIDIKDLTIPDGSIITKAVLTFHDIKNWKDDGMDRLYVHLVENPPIGLSEYPDSDTVDTFAEDGHVLQSTFQTAHLAYPLQETDDALSWVWSRYPIPFRVNLSLFGGGYLRLAPQWLIKWGIRQLHRTGRPLIIYIHPREIDPVHPRLPLPLLRRFKCYVNLITTLNKLRWVCRNNRFLTMNDLASHCLDLRVESNPNMHEAIRRQRAFRIQEIKRPNQGTQIPEFSERKRSLKIIQKRE